MQYDANGALLTTEIPGVKLVNRGKVRDVYDLGDALLFVATDRISAFDVVMPCGVPRKGEVLTQISLFWFDLMRDIPNHLISADVTTRPELAAYAKDLQGRSMIVRKAKVMPVECIVRGYLVGSGWKDYQKSGTVSGLRLRDGYQQASKLDEPLFTPSTKAEIGAHDEAISFEEVSKLIGAGKAAALRDLSLKIYTTARDYAEKRGIIVADTKFEFGELDGKIILVDEVLTPDSSRFWPGRPVQGRNKPGQPRQAVCARLPRDARLEQDRARPGTPGRRGEEDLREVSRSLSDADRQIPVTRVPERRRRGGSMPPFSFTGEGTMFADIFAGMDVTQLAVLIVSAILIGINKTAIPGIGVLPVIMLTMAFEGRLSTGCS